MFRQRECPLKSGLVFSEVLCNSSSSIVGARPQLGKICEILRPVAGFAHQFSDRDTGGVTTARYNLIFPCCSAGVWQCTCLPIGRSAGKPRINCGINWHNTTKPGLVTGSKCCGCATGSSGGLPGQKCGTCLNSEYQKGL